MEGQSESPLTSRPPWGWEERSVSFGLGQGWLPGPRLRAAGVWPVCAHVCEKRGSALLVLQPEQQGTPLLQ